MIMADVLTWFLIVIGTLLVIVALWLAAFALFPARVEACSERYGRRPVVATLLGLVVLVPSLFFSVALAKNAGHPAVNMAMVALMTIPTLLAFLGSAGLAFRIGSGLASSIDAEAPWRRVLRGGVVLSLVFVLPILGWFVLLPWALTSGLGAALMGFSRSRARTVHVPAPPLPHVVAAGVEPRP